MPFILQWYEMCFLYSELHHVIIQCSQQTCKHNPLKLVQSKCTLFLYVLMEIDFSAIILIVMGHISIKMRFCMVYSVTHGMTD
jgi:hypothetical protein